MKSALLAFLVLAQQGPNKAVDLKVGDAAPVFESVDDAGKSWKSADIVGKKILVVYFYPASFTGGCTKQACGFRDDLKPLNEKGVEVVGISGDTPRTQGLFRKAQQLPFALLADEKGAAAGAFGVPVKPGGSVKQTIDGKEETLTRGVTLARWTFIIDAQGKIAYKNTQVNAAEDSKAVLEAIKKLQ